MNSYLFKKSIWVGIIIIGGLMAPHVFADEITSSTSSEIQNKTTLILALEKDYPPFLFFDNDVPQGIAYDYSQLLAKKLGKKLETTEPLQLQVMLDRVKNGQADFLADITKTPERDAYLEFSESYTKTPAVVIARKDTSVIWGEFVPGTKVAVGKGYGVVSFLKEKFPQLSLVELDSDSEVIKAVAFGVSDAGVLDVGSLSYLLQQQPLSNIEVIGDTGFSYSLSFAVAEKDKAIIPEINTIINNLTAEERSAIYARWLSIIPYKTNNFLSTPAYIGASILGIIIIIGFIWNFFLRKAVKNKTKELVAINQSLDLKVNEKVNEITKSKEESDLKAQDLEKTKRALTNVLEDIEKEKASVEQLANKLKLATESGKIGVWDWDVVQNIITWDDQMYVLYGIKKEDFGGAYEAWQSGLHPDDKASGDAAIQQALRGEKDFDTVFRVVWPTGDIRYIHAYAKVKRDAAGKPLKMIGVNLDITREKEIDIEKTEFVSLASHQLKTPIGSIAWDLEMLEQGDYGKLLPAQEEVIQEMYTMNKRMNDLVDGFLNVSRIDLGVFIIEPVPVNWGQICDENIKEFTSRLEIKKHTLVKKYDDNIPDIPADPKLLHIIFQNYISNAIKYTPSGGSIHVTITQQDQNVVIQVSNNGDPIPEKDQGKIFSKLFRASNANSQDPDGNGLGLYILKKIAENGGGKAWFESRPGQDTSFFVSFPITGMLRKEGTKKLS